MNLFEGPMPIDTVHDFLMNPRNLTWDEFCDLTRHIGLTKIQKIGVRTITEDGTEFEHLWDVMVECGFFESKGDIKKMIGNKGLFVNNKLVVDRMVITKDLFFDAGNDFCKFIVVRKGKKDHDLIFGFFRE